MMPPRDVYYRLKRPGVATIRRILSWAAANGKRTFVDMRSPRTGLSRVKADKSFSEVLAIMDRKCVCYFRMILRRQMNTWLLLPYKNHIRDVLEIGIRGIDVGTTEYFIFIYLAKSKLKDLLTLEDLSEGV